ncbi:MAG: hypothetical protein ACT4OU_03735 [Hyphomicrobium sp.]
MWPEAFDRVVVSSPPGQLPIRLINENGVWSRAPGLALMAGLAALIVGPQIGIALYAVASPDLRHAVAGAPIAALELALALVVWMALVCWPLRIAISRLARRRDVEITATKVLVEDRNPLGQDAWSAPLAEFTGVAHHIRSSLSGLRHELVLVHPERGRSILLTVAEQISEREAEAMARLLRLPRVAADKLYGAPPVAAPSQAAAPQAAELAAAA